MVFGVVLLGMSALYQTLQFQSQAYGRQLYWLLLTLLMMSVMRRCVVAVIDPTPQKVQAGVKLGILSLIWLDAATALAVAGPVYGVAIAALMYPRAFEAAARHLSFKLAAHELHVTPAAVGQQVKALEARLGVRLFERLHKQLILTEAGQAYLPEISDGFRRIADATAQLKPVGAVLLQLGVHGSFDLRRLALEEFRTSHAEIGLRVLQPAGLHELVEGKVDVLIARGLGHHPGYRCDRVGDGSGVGDWLVAPAGTADCPEIASFRDWLRGLPAENAPALHRRRLVGIVRS